MYFLKGSVDLKTMHSGSILRANSHFLFGTFTLSEGGGVLGALTTATKSTRFGDKMTKQAQFHLHLLSQSNKKRSLGNGGHSSKL